MNRSTETQVGDFEPCHNHKHNVPDVWCCLPEVLESDGISAKHLLTAYCAELKKSWCPVKPNNSTKKKALHHEYPKLLFTLNLSVAKKVDGLQPGRSLKQYLSTDTLLSE